jgi:hypothetical protein
LPVFVGVVGAVGDKRLWPADRGDQVEQRQKLGDVVAVAAG